MSQHATTCGELPVIDLVGLSINHTRLTGANGPQVALAPQGGTQDNRYAQCRQEQDWKQSLDLARLRPPAYLCLMSPDNHISVIRVAQVPNPANDYIATLFITLWK